MNDEQRAELVDYIAAELSFVNSEGMYSQANIRARAERIADRATTVAEPDAETVERVAKAIHDTRLSSSSWELTPNDDREPYRRQARAAIAAMPSGRDTDLQRDISTWARETFPNTPEPTLFNKLRDEVIELAEARHEYWLASDKGDHPEWADPQAVAEEAADFMHILFQIAERFGFDLLEETRKKFEVNKQRSWEKQADGTYQHKEATNG